MDGLRERAEAPEADRPREPTRAEEPPRPRMSGLEAEPAAAPPREAAERIAEYKRRYANGLAAAKTDEVRLPDELAGMRDVQQGPVEKFRDWRDRIRGPDTPDEASLRVDRPESNDPYNEGWEPNSYDADALRQPDGRRTPLFDGPPRREDAEQGDHGDCGVIATMGGVAGTLPDKITDAIKENPDGTYSVTLHQVASSWPKGITELTGRTTTFTVTPDLPVHDSDGELAGAQAKRVAWPAVLEKAIAGADQAWTPEEKAEWDERWAEIKDAIDAEQVEQGKEPFPDGPAPTGFVRIGQGSDAYERADLLSAITGRQAEVRPIPDTDEGVVKALFADKLAYDKPVIVGSRPLDADARERRLEHRLYPSHVYEVTGLTGDGRIELRNPWGRDHPEPLTPAEFRENFTRKRSDGTRDGRYTTLT